MSRRAAAPTMPHMSLAFLLFRLLWRRPAGDRRLPRARDRQLAGGRVLVDGRAGADVDVGADLGVADVGEVVGLRALADAARLHLDEIADVHLVGEARAG